MKLHLFCVETGRLPMVTDVQVNTRKRKNELYSSCPCPDSERGCGYIAENLGLKNSPSTGRAVEEINSSGAERKGTAQRYPKTVQQALCTASAPSTHTAQHSTQASPALPSQIQISFLLLRRERGKQTKKKCTQPSVIWQSWVREQVWSIHCNPTVQ